MSGSHYIVIHSYLGLKVAYWLKHWTVDQKVQGSSPTWSRDLFLFWMHSALPQKLSERFTFMSFGGDIKPSVYLHVFWRGHQAVGPGETLKISLSAIGSFLISWVIPGKPS